ncbi:MAG: insulinase family protein, partial [Rhodobacteraceae bacterium]|nr:insulinase family protein [Paracoccaceae bacterium]
PVADLPPRDHPTEPTQYAERRLIMHDARVGQPYLYRLYLAPRRLTGDQHQAAAFQVLAALLGGSSQTSVLERALTYDQNIAVSAWAGYDGSALDQGTFTLGVMPKPDVTLQQAEDAMDQVLADFIANGPDPEQFQRVRMQLRASAIYDQDDTAGRAQDVGADLAIGLTLQDYHDWLDELESVTPEEVVAAARQLNRNASVTGWLMAEDAQ